MSIHTDPKGLYDRLREEGLFEEFAEDLQFSDDFVHNREQCRELVSEFDHDIYTDRVDEYTADGEFSPDEITDDTLADAIAIYETCETIDPTTSAYVALSIARSETDDDDPNLPAGFVALSGEEIEPFMQTHSDSIFYCWREDCEPCEMVREDLGAFRHDGTIPESIGLGAVYGPDNVEVLREEYEVGAAPTVLFCSESTIESRFVGNPGTEALRREIETLVDDFEEEPGEVIPNHDGSDI